MFRTLVGFLALCVLAATLLPVLFLALALASTPSAASTGCSTIDGGRLPDAALPYLPLVVASASANGVPAPLLAGLIQIESGWDPMARSPAGAMGLTQLMPATARGLGVTDPFDPSQSVEGGARFLAAQQRAFGSWELALAAYNAGPGNVRRYGGIPPFPETQAYVPAVLGWAETFGGAIESTEAAVPFPRGGLQPNAIRVAEYVRALGFAGEIGGWRAEARDPDGHPSGNALDLMVGDTAEGHAQGDYLVEAILARRDELGVDYILWRQRSISANTGWEWSPMGSRGTRTLDHWDHPHVQTLASDTGAALGLGCVTGADPLSGPAIPRIVSGAGFIHPVPGRAAGSRFGPRIHPITGQPRLHAGIDFPAPTGTLILAVAPGVVEHAGTRGGYGNLVILDHGGLTTYYAHQSAIAVVQGQQVLQGQTLGAVGSTGASTGPHLHFEVRIDGQPVDPEPFLPPQ